MTTLIEVRCCCVPKKLLGWLPVAEAIRQEGRDIRFQVLNNTNKSTYEVVNLTLAAILVIPALGARRLALKSNDIPVETLRRIPQWVENTAT